jgi:hypothetical protein
MSSSAGEESNARSFWRLLLASLATLVVVGELAIGGVWDLLRIPYAREVMTRLGYPIYLLVILGCLKVPAAVVLMVPGLGRLKQWAYAGAFITYSVAATSHLVIGDDLAVAAAPFGLALLTLISWRLRSGGPGAAFYSTVRGARVVTYWIATSALAAVCLIGGVLVALRLPWFVGLLLRLGYPTYFTSILGVAHLLAAVSLLVPRSPRLKEWAYAGLVFDALGAVASQLAVGDRASSLIAPLLLFALTWTSSALRPAARRPAPSDFGAAEDVAYSS